MLKIMLKIADFLERCSKGNNENTILVTFDVISLYTNNAHAYGLEVLSYWIDKHPGNLHGKFNKKFVLESARLILENNNCKFNNEFFVQINSIAMGTIFAFTYATLSMGYFELTFYRICINEFGETLDEFILENWCRFLDDCQTPVVVYSKQIKKNLYLRNFFVHLNYQ